MCSLALLTPPWWLLQTPCHPTSTRPETLLQQIFSWCWPALQPFLNNSQRSVDTKQLAATLGVLWDTWSRPSLRTGVKSESVLTCWTPFTQIWWLPETLPDVTSVILMVLSEAEDYGQLAGCGRPQDIMEYLLSCIKLRIDYGWSWFLAWPLLHSSRASKGILLCSLYKVATDQSYAAVDLGLYRSSSQEVPQSPHWMARYKAQ